MFTFKRIAFVAAVVSGSTLSAAQSISSQCQSTLASVALSSDASCLDGTGLVALVAMGSNSSVVGPVTSWLSGMCGQPACSNATLANVINNVTSGCSSDLASLNIQSSDVSSIISAVQGAYPTVRQIACLKDTSDNTLCATETLYNIQNETGTLTTSNIESLYSQVAGGSTPSFISNSTITCTNCTKAALNLVNQNMPGLLDADANNTISGQCGATFLNGASPAEISQSADLSSQSTSPNGAAVLSVPVGAALGVAFSSLIAVSSAFALLA
ncbi:hypothetical protein B0H21DRAFT_709268 [Amylocystis lapponica]|nr:hypothetical protein B0H21DRAFT_709268 [Amylocystis lapponica]